MRSITARHRQDAQVMNMEPGEFADKLDDARDKIREQFAASSNDFLRRMATADEATLDKFLQEAMKK